MFKIDQVKSLFDCCVCNKLLVEPITFVCGNNVCKAHIDEQLESGENKYQCDLCQEKHNVPEKGFVINKQIQKALDIQFNTLKLSPIFEECKKTIEETSEIASRIDSLSKDPNNYIYEYFNDIKSKVDLRREELKLNIDQYSDELIKSIEETRLKCTKLSNQVREITSNFEKSKNELEDLRSRFDTFEINDKKYEEIKISADILRNSLNEMQVEFKESLSKNKQYLFKYGEIPIADIFGKINETKVKNSKFLFLILEF